ncbi:unnamed protein product [Dicrocoelium dendriticum]|nr:unnamed protein product [Dicrocoelium dendriticum]
MQRSWPFLVLLSCLSMLAAVITENGNGHTGLNGDHTSNFNDLRGGGFAPDGNGYPNDKNGSKPNHGRFGVEIAVTNFQTLWWLLGNSYDMLSEIKCLLNLDQRLLITREIVR